MAFNNPYSCYLLLLLLVFLCIYIFADLATLHLDTFFTAQIIVNSPSKRLSMLELTSHYITPLHLELTSHYITPLHLVTIASVTEKCISGRFHTVSSTEVLMVEQVPVADPGFPVGGGGGGGHRPVGWVLTSDVDAFRENTCEDERIGSHWGCAPAAPRGSANGYYTCLAINTSVLHLSA